LVPCHGISPRTGNSVTCAWILEIDIAKVRGTKLMTTDIVEEINNKTLKSYPL